MQQGSFSGISRGLSLKSAEIHDVLSGRHPKYHAMGADRHAPMFPNTVAPAGMAARFDVNAERTNRREDPRRAVAISQHAAL
jgi:hypothetical protein